MIIRQIPNDRNAHAPADLVRRSVSVLVWAVIVLTLVTLPLRIIRHSYLPPDDALRHAAKAVSGKGWPEILVMRPEITMDHNPGWHWILGLLHRIAGWGTEKLAGFSVVGMFLLFAVSPLFWFRRPEAWLASLAVLMLIFPYFAERAFIGRPLFVTMAASLVLLCLWTRTVAGERAVRHRVRRQDLARDLASVALIAVSVWVHGSWYLLALLPISFFLAQAWGKGMRLALCWLAGSIVGALPTGEAWAFLKQSVLIPVMALGQDAPANSLVGEFQPFTGGYPAVIVVGLVLLWRKLAGRPGAGLWRDPVFWMALVGWAMGFRVLRFWLDWGLPALGLWLARQIQELLETQMSNRSWRRAVLSGCVALVLLLAVAGDRAGRWSQSGAFEYLDSRRPEHAEWLPDEGGILYCVDLSVFYETFFRNPHGKWRYILGFEPAFMRPEDLAVYQELWRTLNAVSACAPWVERMTPADRLVLRGGPRARPGIEKLEWHYAIENTWVGRLPRPESDRSVAGEPVPAAYSGEPLP